MNYYVFFLFTKKRFKHGKKREKEDEMDYRLCLELQSK
jgi:hypothetical protein